jgi:hypothetical protein
MIAPVGVNPDDLVVIGLIIAFSIWYVVHRIRNKATVAKDKINSLGTLTGEQKKILLEKAERRDGLKENIMSLAETMFQVPSTYPIREAAQKLGRSLVMLRSLDDTKWDSNQNLRRLATYYCETAHNVYNVWLSNKKDKELTTQIITLFNEIADASNQLTEQMQSENLLYTKIDIEVAHNQLFNNFGIKKGL